MRQQEPPVQVAWPLLACPWAAPLAEMAGISLPELNTLPAMQHQIRLQSTRKNLSFRIRYKSFFTIFSIYMP